MIKIEIISFNGMPTAQPLYSCFNELGGNIGRADGNTLVLDDPTKTISRIHATISFRMGQYYIRGIGRLPLYLNELRLANDQDTPIHAGDMIQIGPYQLQVLAGGQSNTSYDIDPFAADAVLKGASTNNLNTPASDFDPFAGIVAKPNPLLEGLGSAAKQSLDKLDESTTQQKRSGSGITEFLNPKNPILNSSHAVGSVDDPMAALGFSSETTTPSQPYKDIPELSAPMPPVRIKANSGIADPMVAMGFDSEKGKSDLPPGSTVDLQESIQPKASKQNVYKAPLSEHAALLAAFLEGAGMTNLVQDVELTPELMRLIGELLRESTQGTLDLLAARANIRKEMRAEMTIIAAKDNNPLKFSPRVEVALNHLLTNKGEDQGFMSALQSLRDAYDDLRSHQFGFLAGMRGTLSDQLQRFSPEHLEKRLAQKTWIDSIFSGNRKAKLWDLFTEHYHEISQEAQEDFDSMFGKAFLREYENQVARLEKNKKKS